MLKDEKGITLVELLAVLAILSIILMLVGSTHLFGQRQYFEQNKTISHQGDVRAAISQLTTDVRKVTANEGVTTSTDSGNLTVYIGANTYTFQNTTLSRNGTVISHNIQYFTTDIISNESAVSIEISSVPDDKGKRSSLETVLYLRR